MKILSPAGNFESLKMAIYNGADEVYLGINNFNARNNIEGFSIGTLKEAVDFAHLYGVKVHLAINILFSDNELESALDVVCKSLNLGVDAFIVQDLGLISLINKLYPEAEIHLSTQMGIHNLEGVLALKNYKFKRVVLSRETSLEEIKRILTPNGNLLARVNSTLDINHGAGQGKELEKNYYFVEGYNKRFFTLKDAKKYFSIIGKTEVKEDDMLRYEKPKKVIEIKVKKIL